MAKSNNKANKNTKEVQYAVKYLYEVKKLSSTEISLELGVAEAIVQSIIDQPKEEKPRQPSKSQSLMVRQTAAKAINNVSVMTEAASQLNDELTKNLNSTASRSSKNSIFRPNG